MTPVPVWLCVARRTWRENQEGDSAMGRTEGGTTGRPRVTYQDPDGPGSQWTCDPLWQVQENARSPPETGFWTRLVMSDRK